MKRVCYLIPVLLLAASCTRGYTDAVRGEVHQPVSPVLTLKADNPVWQLRLIRTRPAEYTLQRITVSFAGTTDLSDIEAAGLCIAGPDGNFPSISESGMRRPVSGKMSFEIDTPVDVDTLVCRLSVKLRDAVEGNNRICVSPTDVRTSLGRVDISGAQTPPLRVGVALRQHWQDGVHTTRIPGLTTSVKGTLLAIYDARRESSRDLQGDMDIALNRSTDGGRTWSPMQVVLDMGTWGGLPQRYNGVSDACILSDATTGDIYVIGLWMHGVLDPLDGKWIEGITDTTRTLWNHQWRAHGSQPGYGVRESSQFIISKSTDDGLTWSKPENITRQVKRREWWLLAPAPGHGITLSDGTLLFPTEGRDHTGLQFSTVTTSNDGGRTWTTGNPAYHNTNECMAVELSDGSIMLNMRERSNRGREEGNGRAIATTHDRGKTWTEHPTSRGALIEPACQASLHRHDYTLGGERRSVLLFVNPNSKTTRDNMTIKVSFDDGNTWPPEYWMLLDEGQGSGYSCITSVNEATIGVVYEGSGADLVYQSIPLEELINPQNDEPKKDGQKKDEQ